MASRKARKKAGIGRGGKASSPASSNHATDECHNLDSPCCQLLDQITKEIFPEVARASSKNGKDGTSSKHAASPATQEGDRPLFGQIVRNYLLEQRRKEQQPANGNDTEPVKRRRRRKKKKGKETPMPDAASTGVSAETTKSTTETAPEPNQDKEIDPPEQDVAALVETKPPPDHVDRLIDRILKEGHKDTRSSKAANRDLASFVSFLSQRFQQQQQGEQTRGKKKGKSLETSSTNALPTIQVEDLEASREAIACGTCRESVDSYMTSTFVDGGQQRDLEPFIIAHSSVSAETSRNFLSLPVTGVNDEFEIETAFDYVSMEEGVSFGESGITNDDSDFSISLYPVSHEKSKPIELQMKARPENDDSVSFPLSLDDVHQMVRSIILPCGLNENFDEEAENWAPDMVKRFRRIISSVVERETRFAAEMKKVGEKLHELQTRVGETETTTPQTFDVTTSSTLIECDSASDMLLNDLRTMLLTITRDYHELLAFRGAEAECFKNGIDILWREYGTAVETALKGAVIHEGRVMQLATRPGSVPQMFLNASHRSSHRNMLDAKLKAFCTLKDAFGIVLLDHDASGNRRRNERFNLVRKLFTYHAFYSNFAAITPFDDLGELDETCDLLLLEYSQLARTVRFASVNDLMNAQDLRYERLRELIITLHEQINTCHSLKLLDDTPLETFAALVAELNDLMSQTTLEGNGTDELTVDYQDTAQIRDRRNLERAARNVIKQWRLVRSKLSYDVFRSDATDPSSVIRVPSVIVKFIETGETENTVSNHCYGRGVKRRVSCVIAGLLYQWLSDRCREWHAELTQKELLDGTFVLDEANLITNGASSGRRGKSGKKKKKRDKKAVHPLSNDAVHAENVVVADVEKQSLANDDEALDPPQKAQNQTKPPSELLLNEDGHELPTDLNPDPESQAETKGAFKGDNRSNDKRTSLLGNEAEMSRAKHTKLEANEAEQAKARSRETSQEEKPPVELSSTDIPTSMGVIGRSGFQSAESFLVSRLACVLEDSKSSGTSKTVDIVFLY